MPKYPHLYLGQTQTATLALGTFIPSKQVMPPKKATPSSATSRRPDEGKVACSPHEWAEMVRNALSIPIQDKTKNDRLWAFEIKEHAFSSGSELDVKDYLRLRVLWYTWSNIYSVRDYMRDNPDLTNDEQKNICYTGYVSPENDTVANGIYEAIKSEWDGYRADIMRISKGEDVTRPSADCGLFYMT